MTADFSFDWHFTGIADQVKAEGQETTIIRVGHEHEGARYPWGPR